MHGRRAFFVSVVASLALTISFAAMRTVGQEERQENVGEKDGAQESEWHVNFANHKYRGPDSCLNCHRDQNAIFPASLEYIDNNQAEQWKKDLHKKTWGGLTDPGAYGATIGQRLSRAGLLSKGVMSDQCMNCHTLNATAAQIGQGAILEKLHANGVSCEGCHGPSDAWFDKHQADPDSKDAWRFVDYSVKADAGMVAIRDPIERSRVCVSCHVGNAKQGKLITHAMYAAGHPPLGNFESQSFCANMPTHWRLPRKKEKVVAVVKAKKPEARSQAEAQFLQHAEENYPAKLAFVSACVTLAESLKLHATHSTVEASIAIEDGKATPVRMPELARYDCAACHHDLVADNLTTAEGGTRPGRPGIPKWSVILLRAAARPVNERDQSPKAWPFGDVDAALQPLYDALNSEPFGNQEAVRAAAADLAKWADAQAQKVSKHGFGDATVLRLLRRIAATAPQAKDYDAARQVTGAFWAIYQESRDMPTSRVRFASPEKIEMEFTKTGGLKELFFLDLNLDGMGERPLVMDTLSDTLSKRADFRHKEFAESFNRIGAGLRELKK